MLVVYGPWSSRREGVRRMDSHERLRNLRDALVMIVTAIDRADDKDPDDVLHVTLSGLAALTRGELVHLGDDHPADAQSIDVRDRRGLIAKER